MKTSKAKIKNILKGKDAFGAGKIIWGTAFFELCDNGSIYCFENSCRRNGHGAVLLNRVCKEADKIQIQLSLTAASNKGIKNEKLVNYYKRFGFQENEYSSNGCTGMIRVPSIIL